MAESVEAQLRRILTEFVDDEEQKIEKITRKVAQDTARQLKGSSPKESGKYASGWRMKSTPIVGSGTSYTVYNGAKPGLTHLLEHGHVSRNQYGTYGRVGARVHIAPVEQAAIQSYIAKLEAEL